METMTYKVHINDREYSSWEFFESNKFQKIEIDVVPLEHKLFSNDVFSLERNKVKIIHSSVRCGPPMPGVLILVGNKTYGRQKSTKKNQPKLLYKCVPDDMRLPSFLVPYEIKTIGFSKILKNMYVTFSFNEWNDKHPYGTLNHVIGTVDILDNFYEYQLYCKSLNASIQKFQKDTSKAIEKHNHDTFIESIKTKYPSIEDRTNQKVWNIFTIDPPKSVDLDDGFSIRNIEGNIQQISIYISNVTIWMDVLNLWDSFSRRISTIYLPDKKRPMLPTILSDCLCSLQEKVTRIAFVMDVFIKDEKIIDIKFCNSLIKVSKNYSYEDPELLINYNYLQLLEATKSISKKLRYINNVRNSHEMVCYLMILMNFNCAKEMLKYNTGIFRSTIIKNDYSVPDGVPEDVSKFIKIWNSSAGQYIDGSEILSSKTSIRHELLDMDAYIHITSPIRRLVDLLNILKFQSIQNMIVLSENSNKFYNRWLGELEYINVTMRSIRKVQCDCNLLDVCSNNPDILEKEYDGYLFDKISRNDCLYQFVVFLPELRLSSRITLRDNIDNFEKKKFKLFLFHDEENFKRKIRLHMI
jgi:exoribonuclease R